MDNIQISKRLEGLFARSAFRIAKSRLTHSYKEALFLEILTSHSGVAYQYIWSKLEDWQLFQLSLRIENAICTEKQPLKINAAEYFEELCSHLRKEYPNVSRITTLHALHYILSDKSSSAAIAAALYNITAEYIYEQFSQIESADNLSWGETTPLLSNTPQPAAKSEKNNQLLDKFGVNLTVLAREGKLESVIGRERETERVIDLLSRRKKSNPVLVGEAGVGKSAIVEGLAIKIANGEVPPNLQHKQLYSLDISQLVAGTKFRGEFEERMQQLLEAVRSSQNIILFIDEIHTIVGAGASQSTLDSANILKPALARGEVQTIGATTLDEYRNSIESDSALERRFQKVLVEPTNDEQTLEIIRRIAPSYEDFHKVKYSAEALEMCVSLSSRYITDRHQPDKAIDLLDEAGARARRWNLSSESTITHEHIREVVSSISGVNAKRVNSEERERLSGLSAHLKSRVIGQDSAIDLVSSSILRSRAGLNDNTRPIGVFLFVGPTGVGKTMLAKELNEWLFDSQRGVIRIDMSEYSERHSISRLIGSPPGYVGYGEGGELTEAVRRQSYSVILFDEIEKAHPEVLNIMLQIFDEGHLTDSAGRVVNFKNSVIIMTSNVGSTQRAASPKSMGYSTQSKDFNTMSKRVSSYTAAIEKRFSPELLNRIDDIIVFRSLTLQNIEQIVDLEVDKLRERCQRQGYKLRLTPAARKRIAEHGYHSRYGARALQRALIELLEQPLSQMIVSGALSSGNTVVFQKSRCGNLLTTKVA